MLIRTIALLSVAALAFVSCENDEEKINALFTKKLGVDEAVNIESFMSQGGHMRAKLTAPLMLRYQDTGSRIVLPKTLHVDVYDSTLSIESRLDAFYASYFENRNIINLNLNQTI